MQRHVQSGRTSYFQTNTAKVDKLPEVNLNQLSFETTFKLLAELASALPLESKDVFDSLKAELISLDFKLTQVSRRNDVLREQYAELQERYDQLSTDEFAKTGYIFRKTPDGGRIGPYCPIHRNVLLMQVDDRWGGMYCTECKTSIRDQSL